MGAKTFLLLQSLTAPVNPQELSYNELTADLKAHFKPKPLVIAERLYFYQRSQLDGKPIANFMAELQCLAAHFEFREQLNDELCDHLVCGLKSETAQRHFLSEADLTFKLALKLAQIMETADTNTKSLKCKGDDTSAVWPGLWMYPYFTDF